MTILPLIVEGVMNFSISKLRAELERRHLLLKVDTYSGQTKIDILTLVLGLRKYFGI